MNKCCATCKWFVNVSWIDYDVGEHLVGECMINGKINATDDLRYGGRPICEAKSSCCTRFESKKVDLF